MKAIHFLINNTQLITFLALHLQLIHSCFFFYLYKYNLHQQLILLVLQQIEKLLIFY